MQVINPKETEPQKCCMLQYKAHIINKWNNRPKKKIYDHLE